MELLYKFSQPFIGATVTSRPSRTNKSPYLVDCRIDGADTADVIVHNPALKCNGLVEPGARVYLQPAASAKSLSKYVLYLVEAEGELICIHPTIANKICEGLIRTGRVARGIAALKAEVTHGECRFDFCGQLRGNRTFIEVKAAPIADYVNCLPRARAKALKDAGDYEGRPKMAIFPFGNKQKEGLVSERALKHVGGLQAAVAAGDIGYLVYISMRADVDRLKVSELDSEYRAAVMEAGRRGVFVRAFSVRWTIAGECFFERPLVVT